MQLKAVSSRLVFVASLLRSRSSRADARLVAKRRDATCGPSRCRLSKAEAATSTSRRLRRASASTSTAVRLVKKTAPLLAHTRRRPSPWPPAVASFVVVVARSPVARPQRQKSARIDEEREKRRRRPPALVAAAARPSTPQQQATMPVVAHIDATFGESGDHSRARRRVRQLAPRPLTARWSVDTRLRSHSSALVVLRRLSTLVILSSAKSRCRCLMKKL